MDKVAVIDHIVKWLNDYCEKAGTKGFVIGISGGIDSALTSTLCAKTGKKIIGVNMPIFQHEDEYQRANDHIKWLKKHFDIADGVDIDLTKSFVQLRNDLPENAQQNKLAMANTRARIRMTTLYAVAQANGMLVAGTGNKVEDFGIGFYTKYGDGGVDLSPIADLMKSDVYALAEELNVIPSILKAKPTDGLWEDRREDEDQIGASYDELEWAMKHETGKLSSTISERQKEVLEIFRKFNSANKHKMIPIPVCEIPEGML